MRYNDLPERWKAKLQQHVATTGGGEFRGLSASDFSGNTVAITFEDGSQVEFRYAFVIEAPEFREPAHTPQQPKGGVQSRRASLGAERWGRLVDAGNGRRRRDECEEVMSKILQYATVPVISLESATLHPLQSFADLITVAETKQKERVKVVLTWAPHVRALPQCVPNSFCDWFSEVDWVDFVI
nr:hypothetical protein [Tanacetum cinerariifolium]